MRRKQKRSLQTVLGDTCLRGDYARNNDVIFQGVFFWGGGGSQYLFYFLFFIFFFGKLESKGIDVLTSDIRIFSNIYIILAKLVHCLFAAVLLMLRHSSVSCLPNRVMMNLWPNIISKVLPRHGNYQNNITPAYYLLLQCITSTYNRIQCEILSAGLLSWLCEYSLRM